ncbi:MAG: hypothetical protein LBM25_05705 [Bacteroidales bacterium]|jgi:hypothetical protein|nr:hypothetical protein [Bacteroidales bacterium]
MEKWILLFIITAVLLIICFCFIAIKMFFKKNGEFKRQCSSVDPTTGERINCFCDNKSVYNECKKKKKYEPFEINKEFMEEIK